MLRAVRFAARFGYEIEPRTFAAMHALSREIRQVSSERVRDELTRILGPGGFDAQRDIAAITVNRWGHGYAYDMDTLFDDEVAAKRETQLSHRPVGRIHFAGTDAAWMAYAHWAMDSAQRATQETLT
jgi:spermidine dehydrogenase